MSMLDRLRDSVEEDALLAAEEEDIAEDAAIQERRVLGMNAVERMLVAIMLFIATSVLGSLILIALGRVDIGL